MIIPKQKESLKDVLSKLKGKASISLSATVCIGGVNTTTQLVGPVKIDETQSAVEVIKSLTDIDLEQVYVESWNMIHTDDGWVGVHFNIENMPGSNGRTSNANSSTATPRSLAKNASRLAEEAVDRIFGND